MKLMLAMDIADRLREATTGYRSFDVEAEARGLVARHPEAHVTVDEVVETLLGEMHVPMTRQPQPCMTV